MSSQPEDKENKNKGIYKSQSCSSAEKPVFLRDKTQWWFKGSKGNSITNIEITELEKVDEEEEMEVLVNSTSPSFDSTDNIPNKVEYEEDLYQLRSSKACHCCNCMKTKMENLPKPPSATDIIKSQSLTNILHNQSHVVNESRIKLHNTPKDIIQTREQETGKLVTYSLDILNFQGHLHSPEEVAPLWKKDCRTWLWKSNTAAAKRRLLHKK